MTNKNKIIISVGIVLILLVTYIAFDGRSKQDEVVIPTNTIENTATTTVEAGGLQYTIEPVSSNTSVPKPIPDLDRAVVKSSLATKVTDMDVLNYSIKIKELQTLLKSNPSNFKVWLDLGAYQKNAGDYDGAIISWEYASKLKLDDFISFGNIGNLYGYQMKNGLMSEVYYKKAISRDPQQSYLYAQLAEIYQYILNDTAKARSILQQGLKAIPNDPNLTELYLNIK